MVMQAALVGGVWLVSLILIYLLCAVSGPTGQFLSPLLLGVDATQLTPWPLPFTVGSLAWLTFVAGSVELWQGVYRLQRHQTLLDRRLLPEDPTTVLTPTDAGQLLKSLRLALRDQETTWLYRLVQRLVYQFQSTQQIHACQGQLQLSLAFLDEELRQPYENLTTLVHGLSLLAVVTALSGLLWMLYSPTTEALNVALGQSLGQAAWIWGLATVLALGGYQLHQRERRLLNRTGQYCLDHLLNRFFVERP